MMTFCVSLVTTCVFSIPLAPQGHAAIAEATFPRTPQAFKSHAGPFLPLGSCELVRGSPSPARKRILLSSQCAESARPTTSWWPLAVVQLGRDNGFLAVEDVLDQGYVIVAAAGYTTCAAYSATGVDYYVELHVGEREHLDHAL